MAVLLSRVGFTGVHRGEKGRVPLPLDSFRILRFFR
jgi:hypothetical protein